jgi:hypothetical protein
MWFKDSENKRKCILVEENCYGSCKLICIHNVRRSDSAGMDIFFARGRNLVVNPLKAELNPICHLVVLSGDLAFMGPCIVSIFKYTCISNKMQRYTLYFYLESALHVSGGTSTHSSNGVTNTRCCRYSCMRYWWWVEVPPETCRAVSRYK